MHRIAGLRFSIFLWIILVCPMSEIAAAPQAEKTQSAKTTKTEREKDRQIATIAGWLLAVVAGAAIVGLGLVLMWGRRVKRIAREPLPETKPHDPLWYLRGKPGQSDAEDDTFPEAEDDGVN